VVGDLPEAVRTGLTERFLFTAKFGNMRRTNVVDGDGRAPRRVTSARGRSLFAPDAPIPIPIRPEAALVRRIFPNFAVNKKSLSQPGSDRFG